MVAAVVVVVVVEGGCYHHTACHPLAAADTYHLVEGACTAAAGDPDWVVDLLVVVN